MSNTWWYSVDNNYHRQVFETIVNQDGTQINRATVHCPTCDVPLSGDVHECAEANPIYDILENDEYKELDPDDFT